MIPMFEIDLTGVPPNKRNHKRVLDAVAEMRYRLSHPSVVEGVCIHEAGHFFYYMRAGAKPEGIQYDKSRIVGDPDTPNFEKLAASIRATSWEPNVANQTSEHRVYAMAVVGVAGGIATRVLTKLTDLGDIGDYERFQIICEKTGLTKNCDAFWTKAHEFVDLEMQKEDVQNAIRDTAALIRPEFFGV